MKASWKVWNCIITKNVKITRGIKISITHSMAILNRNVILVWTQNTTILSNNSRTVPLKENWRITIKSFWGYFPNKTKRKNISKKSKMKKRCWISKTRDSATFNNKTNILKGSSVLLETVSSKKGGKDCQIKEKPKGKTKLWI